MSVARARIFLVQDEKLGAKTTADRLAGLGYDVCGTARRGKDAIEAIAETPPDLVLMEIQLAGRIDGVETAVWLGSRMDLPVVLMTAESDDELIRRALAAEPLGYLVEPFEDRELHAVIQMALAKHRLERVLKSAKQQAEQLARERTAALAASEARFAAFARIGADWLWETDAQDRFIFFSTGLKRTGIDPNPRLGHTRREGAAPTPDNLARIDELEQVVARREPFHNFTYRAAGSNGSARWVMISGEPIYAEGGGFTGYRGVGRDVEDEIGTRRALENKTRILDAAFAATPDAVSVTNADFKGVEWNERFFELFDLDRKAALEYGDPVRYGLLEMARRGEYGPGVPEKVVEARRSQVASIIAEAGFLQYERQMKSGRWLEARLTAIEGGGWVSLYRDITDRKKAEIALRELNASLERRVEERTRALAESERFSRGILDSIGAHVAVLAADGSIVATNAAWRDFAANNHLPWQKALEGDNYVEALGLATGGHARDARSAIAAIFDVSAGRRDMVEFEYPCHKPDRQRWFWCRIIRLSSEGEPRVVVSHHDVTAVHMAREQAAARERTFASLAEVSPVGIFRTAADGGVLEVNQRWCEITGLASAQGQGDGWAQALHPDDRQRVVDEWRGFVRGGGRFRSDCRFVHADGSVRWVVGEAMRIGGPDDGYVGTLTDITPRKLIEMALATSRDNLSDALESIDRGVILYDKDDRVVIFNTIFRDHFPGPPDAIRVGAKFGEIFRKAVDCGAIIVPEGMEKEAFIAERVARHRRADGQVMTRRLGDGRILQVTEHAARNGGIIGIGADVTEKLRIEEQLRAVQKMEAIGQLTGGMAHDFNNYLGVIVGNLDMLKESKDGDPATSRYITAALEGALRGAELTQSLLAFSRRKQLDPRPTDLNARVDSIAKLLGRTLGEQIEITTSLAPDLWPVEVDAAQLDSCIVNIATNARDAMPGGGTLTIATRNEILDTDYARLNAGVIPGAYALVAISDSGIGMSRETLDRAFEPFFTTKGPGHGTGLGLSMAYGFVKQSGGHIKIYSEPNRGTTVRIYLPRATTAGIIEYAPPPAAPFVGGSETVLVVEDNEQLRTTVAAQLASLGYRVLQAEDGQTALETLARRGRKVDLLFSDVVMPGALDGYDLAKLARERWPGMKVLLTSGFPGEALARIGSDANAFRLLGKPYRKQDLARAIKEALAS